MLVVLPGGPGLAPVVPYLGVRRRLTAAGFRVLMPEHRGVGLSRPDDGGRPSPVEAMRSRYVVADVLRVLDAAELVRELAARELASERARDR